MSFPRKKSDHRKVWIEEQFEQYQLVEATPEEDPGRVEGRGGGEPHDGRSRRSTMLDDEFLSPLTINKASDPVGPYASELGGRCNGKGFLAMPLERYLELLDWTARQVAQGKGGYSLFD